MEKIIKKLQRGVRLMPEEQVMALGMPDVAARFIASVSGYSLCDEAQIKLFELPDELLIGYIKKHPLSRDVQLKMLEKDNLKELLAVYIQKRSVRKEIQLKMLEDSTLHELFMTYVQEYPLAEEVELKLFDMPQDFRDAALRAYIQSYPLCEEAELKLFYLPAATRDDLLKLYAQYQWFCGIAQEKLLDMPNAKELLASELQKGKLCQAVYLQARKLGLI